MTISARSLAWLAAVALASTACSSLLGLDDDATDDTNEKQNGSNGNSSSGSTSGASGGNGGTSSGGGNGSSGAGNGSSGAGGSSGAAPAKGTPLHVFTGEFNGCIVSDTGALACWGSNQSGQLAQGGPQNAAASNVPVRVYGAEGTITKVSTGRSATCLVAGDSLACAGSNTFGELGDGSGGRSSLGRLTSLDGVIDVGLGGNTTCAVQNGGAISCWGANGGLQAGKDDPMQNVTTPNPIATTLEATRVAVNDGYACAASTNAIECWGNNSSNRLGRAGAAQTRVPVPVKGIAGTVTSLTLGSTHACALVDGGARCWGSDLFGELGRGSAGGNTDGATTPTDMTTGITSISAGFGFTCAVKNGGLWCWGQNSQGQLGIADNQQFSLPQPVALGGTVVEVSCSYLHACALREDGAVFCWGSNTLGQLGAGIVESSSRVPVEVAWNLL